MGKIIGKFRLEESVLGKGSFGEVKRGYEIETGKKVAVKIMKKEMLCRNSKTAKQLYREISIMKSLSHPNVVNLFDTLQTSNNIYMVMELVEGGELFQKIVDTRKGLEESVARRYFQDLILGVRYVHQQGVAHRDLKPENILLSEDGLKISDFGLSNIQLTTESGQVVDSMQLQTVCGTPNYVAPEVLEKEGYNGFVADVWSCGVILYVMLAGYLPFVDSHIPTLLAKIMKGEYDMCRDFNAGAKDLISKMLVRAPDARLSIDGIILHKWFQIGFDQARLDHGSVDEPGSPTLAETCTSPRF
eukprot:TRINITY_DN2476_c0_g1_i1.p1 TRINITY_DN2476_c0_g1~~TRINITY_DN2476_c0_g1_i1.p1  ORF type:complete len:302 (+),score=126.43 TRINITY_DN2476_c0_g1_i1:354-1259(+)